MKKFVLAAVIVLMSTIAGLIAYQAAAGATGDHGPYCSAQDAEHGPEAATEELQVLTYEDKCRPIPPATFTDHVCGFRGFVTIPEHDGRLIDYFIGDVEVKAGNYSQDLGVTAHVTAEVRFDGNGEADYHEEFVFSTPDCTGQPGEPGDDGIDGQDGDDGSPGPVTVIRTPPAPAAPIVRSPATTG